jgi:hypothetical protein
MRTSFGYHRERDGDATHHWTALRTARLVRLPPQPGWPDPQYAFGATQRVACCLVFTFLYGALRQVFSLPPPGVSVRAPWEV